MQRLLDIDVDDAGERRVATDAADADGPVTQPHLLSEFEQRAQRHRFAAARTEVVCSREEQVGLVEDLLKTVISDQ